MRRWIIIRDDVISHNQTPMSKEIFSITFELRLVMSLRMKYNISTIEPCWF